LPVAAADYLPTAPTPLVGTRPVFAPVYVDRLPPKDGLERSAEYPDDIMKVLDEGTQDTLRWLWDRAIHDEGPKDDFRGGKDDIFEYVQELQDFSEPYATPKRYIVKIKEAADAISSEEARNETSEYDKYFIRSGYSNILANTIEFFWRASKGRKGHFRWARHDRPYQTFTFTNEFARTADDYTTSTPLRTENWTQAIVDSIAEGSNNGGANFPFDHNAMKDLKLDVFEKVMGKYVHGANLLILPLKMFLNCKIAPRYAPTTPSASLLETLRQLDPGSIDDSMAAKWRDWANDPDMEGLWDREFRALMRSFQENEVRGAQLDALVVGATRDFLLNHCLLVDRSDRFDSEFVGYKCMGGRGYVFTDVRNRPHRKQADHEGLFSRTIIIDCGLNNYERGRLIQTITEFASERIMSLQWLARFRLVHHALNVVQTRISLALSYYQSNRPQPEETAPPSYADRVQRGGERCGPEGLLNSLEFLSSCLSVLNDVIEGGIMDRSNATSPAHTAIVKKLDSIREQPLPGYQSLSEYLERRYTRPLRTITRVGERYEMLRRRITEIVELVNVRMQAEQTKSQVEGIKQGLFFTALAMVLALIALSHPLGETIDNLSNMSFICSAGISLGLALLFLFLYWRRKIRLKVKSKRRQEKC
jgi:hypothetical protein